MPLTRGALARQVPTHPLISLLFPSPDAVVPNTMARAGNHEDLAEMLRTRQAVLLLPVATSLQAIAIGSKEFLETHVAIKNITNSAQFLSINGSRSRRQGDELLVLAGPPTTQELDRFLGANDTGTSTKSLYDTFEFIETSTHPPYATVHIFDEDLIEVPNVDGLVHILLLAEPLCYPHCPWGLEVEMEKQAKTGWMGTTSGSFQKMADYLLASTPPKYEPLESPSTRRRLREPIVVATPRDAPMITSPVSPPRQRAPPPEPAYVSGERKTPPPAATTDATATTLSSAPVPVTREASPLAIANEEIQRTAEAKRAQKLFLEKLTDPRAAPLLRAIREFIGKLEKNKGSVEPDVQGEQFQQFLQSLVQTMCQNPVWSTANATELENSQEAIERFLTSRIYSFAFAPPEDAQRDVVLARRMACLSFIQLKHLDVDLELNEHVVEIACNGLRQLSSMKAPVDKMFQTMNCCKLIMRALTMADTKHAAGADSFLPALIFVILRACPPQLYANMKFVQRYRDQNKQSSSEAAYYFTNLYSAVTFIETVDAASLSIDPDEFKRLYTEAEKKYDRDLKETAPSPSQPDTSANSSSDVELPPGTSSSRPPPTTDSAAIPPPLPLRLSFESTKLEDLRWGDVPALLAEYQELAQLAREGVLSRSAQ